MKKIKNIVIINDFNYIQGGASKVAIDTANLLSNEYNVYFFCGDSKQSSTLKKNIKMICTNQGEALKDKNKLRGIINGIYNFKAKKELKKVLLTLDKNETIIHVHGWTKCLSSSVFDISWKLNFKLVLTMHDYFTACPNGGYFNYKKNEICKLKPLSWKCIKCNCDSRNYCFKIYRIVRQVVQNEIIGLNKKIKNVITISEFSEKILRETLNSDVKITRVYNPIELRKEGKKRKETKKEYYLYVGRVSKEKGVDLFCQAISDLKFKGIVVGDGDQLSILKLRYPNIEFVGWKNSEEVKKIMSQAKALVFPSKWYETAGLTVLEAQSLGVYAIVSKNSAASEFITENENGNLFSDLNDLKNKILKINKKEYYFETKMEQYSYKVYIENIISAYNEL